MLVRDDFRGKRVVNAVIDLPFALPTIVAGLTLLALYGPRGASGINLAYTRAGVLLALLFVTLPFVVRAVQPVLLELDTDMEEAAASLGARPTAIFRRIVFPNLLPAILSGVALAFARAVGEFGAVVLISGNLPFKTEMASVYIFGGSSRRTRRARRRSRSCCSGSRSASCSSSALCVAGPPGMIARLNLPLARFAFRSGLAPTALALVGGQGSSASIRAGELRGIAAQQAHGDLP